MSKKPIDPKIAEILKPYREEMAKYVERLIQDNRRWFARFQTRVSRLEAKAR